MPGKLAETAGIPHGTQAKALAHGSQRKLDNLSDQLAHQFQCQGK